MGPLRGNHYEVLGVAADAAPEQVEKAYRFSLAMYGETALATYTLLDPAEVRQARAQIQEAYDVLRDPLRRMEYDVKEGIVSRRPVRAEAPRPVAAPVAAPISAAVSTPPPRPPAPLPPPSPPPAPPVPAPPVAVARLSAATLVEDAAVEGRVVLPDPVTGAALKRYREDRGIALHDISNRSKIGIRYFQYIEADRYKDLPARVYLRGFVMEYARAVGLDPSRTVEAYLAALPPLPSA